MDHLYDASLALENFFSRSRIPPITKCLNSCSLSSSFGWSTTTNFSEGPALSIGPFQKVQQEVFYSLTYLEKMKSCHKFSRNCSIHGKNCEISSLYNFWKPIKTISLMFETETVGHFLVQKLNRKGESGAWPPGPPVATPLSPWTEGINNLYTSLILFHK